jgi:[ribosomal protein S5]-alanine N-acetyltransferase
MQNKLETPRLRLRPYTWADLDWLEELFSDPEVMKYIAEGRVRTRDETMESLSRNLQHWIHYGFGLWVVVRKEDERAIGRCGVGYFHEHGDAELTYTFARPYWNQGYGTESVLCILNYAWKNLHLPKVIAHARVENQSSIRIMEKVGMKFVGTTIIEDLPAVGYEIENPLLKMTT